MPRILLLPLDERPCNFLYPALMVEKCTDVQLLLPPKELMGSKKRQAEDGIRDRDVTGVQTCALPICDLD